MALFDDFPLLDYSGYIIKDISRRLVIPESIKNNVAAFKTYIVKDGEKIEDVAFKAYGDPNLHWVIMLMNDIIDPFHDWAMTTEELRDYVNSNYTDGEFGIHHWEKDGLVVNSNVPGAVSITNFEYESNLNEERRKIKLIRPEHIQTIITEEQTILR
jgi:hypothetical protein